ncbi:major facilitator superfamily domain-containing protein [Truncatella angustata]|uniref:Major facilitator superfamily domain-containing protein n=1 Tax=Truncatella angustata TaxID=152316 RepID=A0A9P8RH73_9PEZI|nr:major facilitator superfamily domain-containing protein [Truncatella angustata]KAH6638520.1 major facilitator superfamily domain-containing protein [Truncatella angustata]
METKPTIQRPEPQGENVVIVEWSGPEDLGNPVNWPESRKWLATSLGLLATFSSIINGSIITTAHLEINAEFNIDETVFPHSYWSVTSWGIGGGLFSLVLLPLMEDFGVRPAFLLTYFVFICFLIPVGLAQNFATLIICRFFSGGCVSILANTVAGIASNVFDGYRARTIPVNMYILFYMAGSSLGPAIGAVILQHLPWRWTGYIELIWTVALFPLFIFAMPESRGSVILGRRARKLRQEGKNAFTREELHHIPVLDIVMNSVRRPIYMLCTEPALIVATVWSAFSFGVIYLFTQSVELVFTSLYGWDAVQAGYVQTALVLGEFLGWIFCSVTDPWYYSSARRNTESPGTPIPEARLYAAVLGGFIGVSGGMFIYAWTSYSWIPWEAPAVGLVMVGAGSTAVVTGIAHYIVDAYSMYAGSAIGAVVLGENMFIAFLPLAAQSMYTTLGFQIASTVLAIVSAILTSTPIALLIWGQQIRSRSRFMESGKTLGADSYPMEDRGTI